MNTSLSGSNAAPALNVVKLLLDKEVNVIAVDVKTNNIDPRAQIIDHNILADCGESLSSSFAKADCCLHLAWQDGFNHNASSHIDNLSAHFIFLKNIIASGVPQIAVMGTMHEIGYWEGKINGK